ncbi:hypothetical protein EWM64_g6230 [Hericium alpestre]|uniref:Uncharacterized protein n=1 Tax=Hericium alpestre TaxID=135208 RepID=A0A4Y9ZSD2_9AGAM|nr:hypothetical protein EWM64_g6230 [Hericium alpestre]
MRIADARSNALPVKPGPRPKRIINTLDPKHLNPGCFMDLSGTGYPKIRFRVTEDSNPASFARGHDLLFDKGYMWYLPVAVVAARASTDVLLRLLVHDGFVDSQVISDLRNSNMSRVRVRRSIGSLSEPFVVDFTKCKLAFTVPAEVHKRKRHIQFALPQFLFWRPGGWGVKLYDEGSALCRFERSTLPQHAGERVIVIRLLKMLVPPKLVPDPPPMEKRMLPAEGELFYKKRDQVWYRNLDQDNIVARLLRVLYDADEEQDADNLVGQ